MPREHDPTTEKGVEEMKKEAERYRLQELSDLRAMLNIPAGCRYIRRLLSGCFEYESTYDKSATTMARNEGRRSLMLQLKYDMSELVVRGMMTPEELFPFLINLQKEESDDY